MKFAATIIKGVAVDCGTNLQEQKAAIRGLLDKYGAGNDKVYVLYSSQRPAVRKRIALPEGDAEKIYAEGVKLANELDAKRKKDVAELKKSLKAEKDAAKKRRAARRDAATTGKKAKKDAAKS